MTTPTQAFATSYADSLVLASKCGLIDEPLRDALLPSVGLRNVLVHEYLEIDLARVRAAIRSRSTATAATSAGPPRS